MLVLSRSGKPIAIASGTGEFVSKTYGEGLWSTCLHELGLLQVWSEAWLPTCADKEALMMK